MTYKTTKSATARCTSSTAPLASGVLADRRRRVPEAASASARWNSLQRLGVGERAGATRRPSGRPATSTSACSTSRSWVAASSRSWAAVSSLQPGGERRDLRVGGRAGGSGATAERPGGGAGSQRAATEAGGGRVGASAAARRRGAAASRAGVGHRLQPGLDHAQAPVDLGQARVQDRRLGHWPASLPAAAAQRDPKRLQTSQSCEVRQREQRDGRLGDLGGRAPDAHALGLQRLGLGGRGAVTEPETIAPAWPIVLPGGAVKPAM